MELWTTYDHNSIQQKAQSDQKVLGLGQQRDSGSEVRRFKAETLAEGLMGLLNMRVLLRVRMSVLHDRSVQVACSVCKQVLSDLDSPHRNRGKNTSGPSCEQRAWPNCAELWDFGSSSSNPRPHNHDHEQQVNPREFKRRLSACKVYSQKSHCMYHCCHQTKDQE